MYSIGVVYFHVRFMHCTRADDKNSVHDVIILLTD